MNNTNDPSPLAAFTEVGHALFARDGVKLAFGRRWDKKLIHISQAERGAACGCYCPAANCRRKLIARKPPSKVAHHFSHAPLSPSERAAGVAPNCRYGPMTALHVYAEQLLREQKQLVLPPVEATLELRKRMIRAAKPYKFDSVKLETMDGETIPDVILSKGAERMHVEVYVTHRCGPEKRAKLLAANISAVEIDLSKLPRDVTFAGLDDAILKTAPRFWIHNRKAQAARKLLEDEAKAEAARIAEERRKTVANLSKAYAAARREALASAWAEDAHIAALTETGDAPLLESPPGSEGYFSVHPNVWRAAVLNLLRGALHGQRIDSILREFRRRGWLVRTFQDSSIKDESLLREAKLSPDGAKNAILAFLRHLVQKGVTEDRGWTWTYTAHHSNELIQRKRKKDLLALEAAERNARLTRLGTLASDIVSAATKDNNQFNLAAWKNSPCGKWGRSAEQIAGDGGTAWREFFKALSTTLVVLKDESEEAAEDHGLPVQRSLAAMREVHELRAAQRAQQAADRAKAEAEARVHELAKAVRASLGEANAGWLDKPTSALRGLTPRAAAAESPDQLDRAFRSLDTYQEHLTRRAIWIAKLEQEAKRYLKDPEHLSLYMNSTDLKLAGGMSPNAYVKDEETMAICLGILKQRAKRR